MTFEIWWERYRMQGQSVLQRDVAKQAWDAAIAAQAQRIAALEAATRRLVEAGQKIVKYRGGRTSTIFNVGVMFDPLLDDLYDALADPVIVALRRE